MIIALDGDGVCLDYHAAYRSAWLKAFGELPDLRDALAYWPTDRWAVRKLEGQELTYFRTFFNEEFWSTIPAIEGAVQACVELSKAGHELVCVSALDARFQAARLQNLIELGFPIQSVIATPSEFSGASPKATALNCIKPIAFVDDYLPYHMGLPPSIHRALIMREPHGSPNYGDGLREIDSTHLDLLSFSNWWLKENRGG